MKPMNTPDAVLNARRVARCTLVEIQAGAGSATFYRFTDHTSNVTATINGVEQLFIKQAFLMANISASAEGVQATQIAFMSETLKAIALIQNMRKWPVNIWNAHLDADQNVTYVDELLIGGTTDGYELNEEGDVSRAVLGVLAGDLREQESGPRQSFGTSCRHRYKDEMCAATSPLPDCPRAPSACIERNNLPRYGGQPYAPVAGAKFMWGPYSEVVKGRPVWVSWD